MKSTLVALLAGGAAVGAHEHHHRHAQFHAKRDAAYVPVLERGADAAQTCGCTTYTTLIYGEPTCT